MKCCPVFAATVLSLEKQLWNHQSGEGAELQTPEDTLEFILLNEEVEEHQGEPRSSNSEDEERIEKYSLFSHILTITVTTKL